MADGHGDIIIIKKKVSGSHPHHGGAWKIAFADFMTAMMAFFLVLWIINASDKDTKTVIARYFNPLKLENPSKAKKGVRGSTASPTEGKEAEADKTSGPPSKKADSKGAPPPSETKPGEVKNAAETKMAQPDTQMQATEAQLFSSPYEALDRIAGAAGASSPGASPELGDSDPQRLNGALSVEAFRDPFKPIGPDSPEDPVAFDADARSKAAHDLDPGKTGQESTPAKPPAAATPNARPHEKIAPGDAPRPAPKSAGGPAESGETAADDAKADKIGQEIKQQVAAALKPGAGPEIEVRQTKDGLLISLTDKLDFSMFGIGSARPAPELVRAMAAVAGILKARPGHIIVRGYTDARPYRNGAYDNWRLSSDRAQMAYYMLTRGGAQAARFVRVEGYADRSPRDAAHPLAAVNRRLEILVEEPKP